MRTDFTRSNVSESTLDVSSPGSSSFDHYHRHQHALPLGKFIPVMCKPLMPNSVLAGNVAPQYTLENVGTPQIGPTRQDTHTIAVSFRRINRDWRMLVEGKSGFDALPQFNVATLFESIMTTLFSGGEIDGSWESVVNKFYVNNDNVDVDGMINLVQEYYFGLYQGVNDFGYNRDWFAIEAFRIRDFHGTFSQDRKGFFSFIYEVAKPYFGNGSILDNLRYPCMTYYSPAMSLTRDYELLTIFDISLIHSWSALFRITNMSVKFLDKKFVLVIEFADVESFIVNEMPLRAQYAAWYDSLRNWHVEERSNLLDPDLWDSQSLLVDTIGSPKFLQFVQLLLPRYRCYGSDAFTTVQTDAAFRHVFNPIFNDLSISDSVDSSFASSDESVLGSIYSVLVSGIEQVFPQGLFKRVSTSQNTSGVWLNDLKTMRRSGMLERYLARDYFFPDTYEGQLRARYGIEPSDLLGVSSQYISGTESFISGDQQIASTNGTDGVTGTPAGTRTFTGGAASNGVVQFASQGDFVFLVTFSSLQPIVTYDSKDMFLSCLTRADLPFPEFADDSNVMIQARDMIRGLESCISGLGYVPRYYGWRTDIDSAHGPFLREYRSFIWLRDWKTSVLSTLIGTADDPRVSPFAISAYGLHVHLPLDAFNGSFYGDDYIAYGDVTFNYSIQAPLPAAVQHI